MDEYRKHYLYNKWNFSFPLEHTGEDEVDFVLNTGDKDIIVHIKGGYFKKTANVGTDVSIRVDVEELKVYSTGGVDTDNYLKANIDRNETDEIGLITLIDDVSDPLVIDRTGSINIFRHEGVASKGVVDYNPNLDFSYRLKKNTDYLVRSIILNGANNDSESILYGQIEEYCKEVCNG